MAGGKIHDKKVCLTDGVGGALANLLVATSLNWEVHNCLSAWQEVHARIGNGIAEWAPLSVRSRRSLHVVILAWWCAVIGKESAWRSLSQNEIQDAKIMSHHMGR